MIDKIKELSLNAQKYDGKALDRIMRNEKEMVRKNPDGERETFKINPENIPGVVEGGWTWNDHD